MINKNLPSDVGMILFARNAAREAMESSLSPPLFDDAQFGQWAQDQADFAFGREFRSPYSEWDAAKIAVYRYAFADECLRLRDANGLPLRRSVYLDPAKPETAAVAPKGYKVPTAFYDSRLPPIRSFTELLDALIKGWLTIHDGDNKLAQSWPLSLENVESLMRREWPLEFASAQMGHDSGEELMAKARKIAAEKCIQFETRMNHDGSHSVVFSRIPQKDADEDRSPQS